MIVAPLTQSSTEQSYAYSNMLFMFNAEDHMFDKCILNMLSS